MQFRKKKESTKIEDTLFVIGNIGILCFIAIWWWYKTHLGLYDFECRIHKTTGLYCPGCGGTRALDALFHGHIIQSFMYHPGVLYTVLICGWFMLSWYIQKLSKDRWKIGMQFRTIYVYIGLAIVMIQWIIKCITLFYI